jgi:predicted secreted protein
MAKINGSKVKILSSGVAITNTQNASIDINGAMIDVTTKDSSGWKEVLPGLKDAQMSCDGIVDVSAGVTIDSLITKLINGTSVAVIFSDGTPTTGKSYSASGYINKCSLKAATEDNYTFSMSITITGALTQVAST